MPFHAFRCKKLPCNFTHSACTRVLHLGKNSALGNPITHTRAYQVPLAAMWAVWGLAALFGGGQSPFSARHGAHPGEYPTKAVAPASVSCAGVDIKLSRTFLRCSICTTITWAVNLPRFAIVINAAVSQRFSGSCDSGGPCIPDHGASSRILESSSHGIYQYRA